MRVGWVGLGAMGAPMAACLARAGHEVTGYDVAPERANALAGAGSHAADSIAAAVETADVIAMMVATPDQLDQALFGAEGVSAAEGLPGTTVMIMATVGPEAVASAATRLWDRRVAVVDAPVSGGVTRATARPADHGVRRGQRGRSSTALARRAGAQRAAGRPLPR